MKKGIKIGILVLLIIIIGAYVYVAGNKGVVVETVTLENKYASLYFTEEGVVGDRELFNVYSKNSGEVLNVYVAEGETIKKGDKIGEISGSQIDYDIKMAEQQIEGYKAQIENVYVEDSSRKSSINSSIDELNSQLNTLNVQEKTTNTSKDEQIKMQEILIENTQNELNNLKGELEKYDTLLKNEVISQSEYDEVKKQVESYENLLLQNQKQLDILKTDGAQTGSEYFDSTKDTILVQISNLRKELSKDYVTPTVKYYNSLIEISNEQIALLNKNKEDLVIVSPYDGVISELPMAKSNFVSSATPVAIIKQESFLIETYISTRDIDSVTVGSKVNIKIDKRQGEEAYTGEVVSIDQEAEVQISSLGVEERKIKVIVQPDEDLDLILGFDVDVEFLLFEKADALTVPKESIFKLEDGYGVYKIVEGVVTAVPIERGVELRSEFVVDSGLGVGDVIIKDSTDENVAEGKKVSLE